MVEITCPNCNFKQEIPEEKIPVSARWASCQNCKQRFEFDLSKPGFDFEEEQGGAADRIPSPWEDSLNLGIWQGIYRTIKAVLFSPDKLFRTMTFQGGIYEPFAFGLLLGSIGTMFGFFWQFLMISGTLQPLLQELIGQTTINSMFLGIIIISPLFITIYMFITSVITHGCLLIVKGGKSGFEGTFRVVAFSQTAQILGLIPLVGGIIGSIWHIIILIIGLREIHEVSYLRVFIALLIPAGLILLLVAASLIFIFGFI